MNKYIIGKIVKEGRITDIYKIISKDNTNSVFIGTSGQQMTVPNNVIKKIFTKLNIFSFLYIWILHIIISFLHMDIIRLSPKNLTIFKCINKRFDVSYCNYCRKYFLTANYRAYNELYEYRLKKRDYIINNIEYEIENPNTSIICFDCQNKVIVNSIKTRHLEAFFGVPNNMERLSNFMLYINKKINEKRLLQRNFREDARHKN